MSVRLAMIKRRTQRTQRTAKGREENQIGVQTARLGVSCPF
jgi:hypothetical protein